ncbi:hypothetical protein MY3296_002493 [Beauveria thailandica]
MGDFYSHSYSTCPLREGLPIRNSLKGT